MSFNIIIVGGGLAGLTSALHLSQKGLKVLLIEKNTYPKHKVCGEYISNEVLPYLQSLGFNPFDYGAKRITDFTISTSGSRSVSIKLPLGGFGISRYCIDAELAKKAEHYGTQIVCSTVQNIQFSEDQFEVLTNKKEIFRAPFVIGSFGKRSNIDIKMNRDFIQKNAPFLGIKAHYKGDFPEESVGLHNFKGGYCGISKVENDHINICYITDYTSFKQFKNIGNFQKKVLSKNTFLKQAFDNHELVFDKPLSISQVSFSAKNPVEEHILMCGDSAGMIHPLAGNGMSMAIRSAQMVCEELLKFTNGDMDSRKSLEASYTKRWNKEFGTRLKSGHIISRLFRLGFVSELIMMFLKRFPFVLPYIIKKTHGKPMVVEL